MTDKEDFKNVMDQVAEDSVYELTNNPEAATGKCVISSAGYSECRDGVTEAACNKQKSPGVTVNWYKGESC